MLLDDLILDVDAFQYEHPGGLYLLANTIGRDISKYFYGGYSHEPGYPEHSHSRQAREVVASIAIGKLKSGRDINDVCREFEGTVVSKEMINSTTAVVSFKVSNEINRKPIDDNGGIGMLGKHYLVSSGGVSR